jgi:Tol biopolymer transport system component
MKKTRRRQMLLLLPLLALLMQSCLGLGGSGSNSTSNFKKATTSNGSSIGINTTNQAIFKGKIYFTLDRNLYYLDGSRQLHQLTHGMDVRDPAVSPNGQWIAFIIRHDDIAHGDYSDLALMPASGGPIKILRTGAGQYIPNPPYPAPISTHHWYAQPSWAADSTHLLFLSDLQKATWPANVIGVNAFLLDLQVFSLSINDPNTVQIVAYASYGAGGDQEPSYRPGHPDQIVYTHYEYDSSQTNVITQIYLEDPNAIVNNQGKGYHPGIFSFDPAVAITPATANVANFDPAFSPDGNYLAYVRTMDATHMGLYIMPVPNGVTQNPNDPTVAKEALQPYNQSSLIVEGQYVSQPVWSPDGNQIMYITYTNNTFDLWLANVAPDPKTGMYTMKGNPVRLTDTGGHLDADSRPFWTA